MEYDIAGDRSQLGSGHSWGHVIAGIRSQLGTGHSWGRHSWDQVTAGDRS